MCFFAKLWFMGRWNHRPVLLQRRHWAQWSWLSVDDCELFADQNTRNGLNRRVHEISCYTDKPDSGWNVIPAQNLIIRVDYLKLSTGQYFHKIIFEKVNFSNWLIESNENSIQIFLFFIPISKYGKKGILTLVIRGWSMRNNRDRYGHVYIFLIRKQKLRDLANVRLTICLSIYLFVRKTYLH